MTRLLPLVAVVALGGCVPGRISSIPMHFDGVDVWVYEGRANRTWQLEEGERMMAEHCQRQNGGRPILVNQTSQISGGTISVTQFGATGSVNRDQRVMFRCEPTATESATRLTE